jgi:dihydroorotate dehydrogenase electron transfer subunit
MKGTGSGVKKIADTEARIVSVGEEQGGVWSALLLAPEIARAAKPMQFVQVKVSTGTDPFLRRPFGISRIDRESGLIGITWALVGKGTALMAEWEAGDTVTVLGPLGNGFEPGAHLAKSARQGTGCHSHRNRRVWLIAGGTGLAPLYPLASSCRELGCEVTLLYGAKSRGLLMDTSLFREMGCKVSIATEDGSEGTRGFVTAPLGALLSDVRDPEPDRDPVLAVACGPTPMLQAVKSHLSTDTYRGSIDLYVSLESRMACGTGLCKGCAVKAAPPRTGYLHVCSDGPVFSAGDVLLGGEN